MAIRYPGGTIAYGTFTADTKALIIDGMGTKLTAAGWTATQVAARIIVTFTGNPNENESVTLDGNVYTAKSAPTGGTRQFDRDGTVTDIATSFAARVNAMDSATMSASSSAGVVTVSWATAGTAGIGKTASSFISNASIDASAFRYGGTKWDSAITAHGLSMRIYAYDFAQTNVYLRASSIDETVIQALTNGGGYASTAGLAPAGGRLYTACVHRYGGFIWLAGSANSAASAENFVFGVPFIRAPQRGFAVSGAADNGSGLVRVTATAHGLTTGDSVDIRDVQIGGSYSSAVNAAWTVTVIDANNVDLQSSTWPGGTYTSSTGTLAGPGQISRAMFAMGGSTGAGNTTWRQTTMFNATNTYSACFAVVNGYSWTVTGEGGPGIVDLVRLILPADSAGGCAPFWGTIYALTEALIAWPVTSPTAGVFNIGELYGAFLTCGPVAMDVIKTSFDSHDWINYMAGSSGTGNSKAALWLQKD